MYLDIVTHTVQRLTDRGPAGFASLRRLGSITAQEQPSSCVSFPVSLVVIHHNLLYMHLFVYTGCISGRLSDQDRQITQG